jgi:hypothetical protein
MSIKVIISFEVEDFGKFKSVFDAGENVRNEAGITLELHKNMDAHNNVWVIGAAASKEVFTEFLKDPSAQERMRNGGVIQPLNITFLES